MIEVTNRVLDYNEICSIAGNHCSGAVVTFFGVTRKFNNNRNVLYLEYEAYQPMADKMLSRVACEAKKKWPIEKLSIIHRIGRIEVGEISLIVAVTSSHRKEALTACEYAIDRIKTIVPIWKKEFFEGGDVWVESLEDISMREVLQ